MGELDDYLEQLAGHKDSSGTFSVDLVEAARKLGQHQLAEPALALLKVIQAAVGWGTRKVAFEEGRGFVCLHFASPDLDLTDPRWLHDFEQRLLHGEDSPHTDLVVGLNTLLQGPARGLTLLRWQERTLVVTRPLLGEPRPRKLAFPWRAGSSLLWEGDFRSLRATMARRLGFLGPSLSWNARPLACPWPDSFPEPTFWEAHQSAGPHGSGGLKPRGMSDPLPEEAEVGLSIYVDRVWESLDQGANVKQPAHDPAPPQGFPVKRGVLLDPVPLDLPDGVAVVFVADNLPVDLSQFNLLRGPAWVEYRRRLEPQVREALVRATHDEEALSRLLHTQADVASGTIPLAHTLVGAGLLAVGVTQLNPVGIVLGSLFFGVGGYTVSRSWSRLLRRGPRRQELGRELRRRWGLPEEGC